MGRGVAWRRSRGPPSPRHAPPLWSRCSLRDGDVHWQGTARHHPRQGHPYASRLTATGRDAVRRGPTQSISAHGRRQPAQSNPPLLSACTRLPASASPPSAVFMSIQSNLRLMVPGGAPLSAPPPLTARCIRYACAEWGGAGRHSPIAKQIMIDQRCTLLLGPCLGPAWAPGWIRVERLDFFTPSLGDDDLSARNPRYSPPATSGAVE